ncbi:hypothetical protein BGZ52_010000 [Haplosporangium bisporale]|nr:hypothetical protein BGZ52_010000 [Haplosporangium bisporale]
MPASDNTCTPASTNNSARTTSTAAFGSRPESAPTPRDSVNTSSSSSTTLPTPVPDTKRVRPSRPAMPPIVTGRAIAPPNFQTPSTPRAPALFSSSSTSFAMAQHHAYPTPSSTLNNATPKTPSSMSEWRMIQMQLQQQDDLHYSLTLPSVSALSVNTTTTSTLQTRSSVSYGLTPVSMAHSTTSLCSCGGCAGGATPTTMAPSVGNQTPGPDSPAVHKHLHPLSNTLSPWTPVYQHQQNNHSFLSSPTQGPPAQAQHQNQIHQIYNLYSSSTSSDFIFQDAYKNKTPGSTATLNSEYAPSSVDPSEFENNLYGPSSAGSEAHLNQFLQHFGRSSPSQQQQRLGGTKHCRNCPVHNNWRPSMAMGAGAGSGSGSGRPSSPGGVEMEFSVSNSSVAGSLNSMRASSPGPFRSLSSKLAATTIRKLSISQKSLFNASKEDLVGWQGSPPDSNSKENITQTESGQGTLSGLVPPCGCTCQGSYTSHNGGSTGSGEGSGSLSKPSSSKTPSRLSGLRRKDKNKNRKSREMDYNYSSRFVREEFAQYNYERQIEDFQRAARVFKEQKALTTAAAAAAIAAEARAAVAEASLSAAATAAEEAAKAKKVTRERSFSSSSTSLVITPIQESEEETPSKDMSGERSLAPTAHHQTTAHSSESAKIRKKSLSRPGLLRSVSRPHRRVGSSTGSVVSSKSKKQSSNLSSISMSGSRGSSIHNGKTDSSYLELGQVGMGMGMDLKLPGLGLPFESGFGLDGKLGDHNDSREPTRIDVRIAETTSVFEDIPLRDMSSTSPSGLPSPLSHLFKDMSMPKKPEDALSFKGRTSNVSQDTRHGGHTNPMRGRSVHSTCSVDTVSQQIAARHHQHSRLNNISSVASLNSPQGQPPCEPGTPTNGGSSGCGGGACSSGANIVVENSPIQVVRATVGTVDDTSLPCFTFRMWVLSTMFVVMGAAISEYNFFRSNSAYFSIYFVQLASYFCGKVMARLLPTRVFEIRFVGLSWLVSKWRFFFGSDDTTEVGVNSGHSDNSTLSGNGRHVRMGSSGAVGGGPIRGTNRSGLSRSNITSTKTGPQSSNMTLGRGGHKEYSWSFTLNPGKFNMKEHMLIGIAAAAGCAPAYASNVIAIQSLVFNLPLSHITGASLVLSSQCIGFSMAWLLFDYVIKPSVMIWPATLVNVSLYNTLHEHKVLTRWFTRMQLFWYAFLAIFVYQWLPKMFMPVLTSMALLCWIKPSNNVLRKLGSGYVGLGMGCVSLDWSIISGVGPLYTPWWAQANFFVGLIVMLWIVTPIVYFCNYWSAMSYPIVSSNLYDNQAELYDISKIVNKDLSFNLTMYEAYSPVIMTPYFAITYGTSFMAVVASFIHVALYYGSDIWLIARTQCGRKMKRIRNSTFGRALSKLFLDKPFPSPKEIAVDSDHNEFATTSAPKLNLTLNGLGTSGLDAYTLDGSRRNSESVSYRADLEGGMAAGYGAEERPSFQQSSHYRQLSQPYDGFQASVHNRHHHHHHHHSSCDDDREQIPTEMFGTEDIHTRLMRAYPEIPGWWFGAMFVVCFTVAVVVCHTSDIQLPVYSLIIALLLAAVFALPMAIIQALSSSQIGLNVLSEVVCGYLLPGNQLGNSVFKCYSYMALYQCLNLTQGFKLGHYMKVPPRKIFIMVLYGTLLGAAVNLEVLHWILTYNRQALFDADLRSGWSFRNLDLFFSASLLWGAISPKRLFGNGSIYHFLPYCFLLGLFLPMPFYLMYRRYPPYGSVCKGSSLLPFLPRCQCPASLQRTSSLSSSSVQAYPKPHHTNRPSLDQETKLANVKIERRFLRWPLFRTRANSHTHDDELGDKSMATMPLPPNEEAAPAQAPVLTPQPPHLYHGNPDSAWEGRLRRVPWHLVNMPLVCVGASFVPQAPASFVGSAGVVAFIFAFLVLRYRHEWWRRYTFVLAAALDAGTQICNMAVFVVFSLILKGAVEFPSWFGNDEQNPEKCGVGDGYN